MRTAFASNIDIYYYSVMINLNNINGVKMIKKIILITSLIFTSTVFANTCNDSRKNVDDLSIKELKDMKKKLKDKLDVIDFEYHYTLAHNRIHIKSVEIKINNKVETMKEVNNNNELGLKKIEEMRNVYLGNLKTSHENINRKINMIYKHKKEFVNFKISKINKMIKDKTPKRVSNK